MPKVSAVEPGSFQHRKPIGGVFAATPASGRRRRLLCGFRQSLVGKVCSMAMTSVAIAPLGGVFFGEDAQTMAVTLTSRSELKDFHRDLVRCQHALRRQDDPDLPGFINFNLHAAAEPAGSPR